jgi:hypothetical protein
MLEIITYFDKHDPELDMVICKQKLGIGHKLFPEKTQFRRLS